MSNWYWRVIALKATFILACFASYLRADDNIQKLPFCNPDNAALNDLVIVSTLDGKLTAFSTQNGIKAWDVKTQPLLSSNLHHVELTAGGKWVRLVPSLRGTLYSLSGENIEPLPFDAEQLLSSSFKYSDDLVIAGARETLWLGVDARTGGVVYECGTGGCSGEQQTASAGRDLLVLRRHSNTVRALDPRNGLEKWNFSVAEHQLALSRRECAGAAGGGGPPVAVAVAVALPEGIVAILRPGDRTPIWQQKLEAPVASMWRLQGGAIHNIDVLWEATRSLVDSALPTPPALYIGVHDRQLYIQESLFYAEKLETAVSAKPVPWKLMNSRPLIEGGETALTPLQHSDPNTLSLITLYGNTGQQGNHGFFLYLQETCEQAVQTEEEIFDGPDIVLPNNSDEQTDHHHVHVHVYSLWFWWKEVLLIAISSALLMNLMIWPRFFVPKVRPATPLPMNQEVIVVERHYERPPSISGEYSGRYEKDFTPLRCLGKGGFGVVFEARNNIDHCSYAVKRITLPRKKSKRDRVLREVRVLAMLEHEHIVRYFNAWVEEPPPNWQEERDAAWAKELTGASVLLSEEYATTAKSPASPPPAARAGRPAPDRGDSVLLNIHKPIDDCVDALDFERRLAEQSKRHRSLSCNDSFSVVYDENENSKHSTTSSQTTTKRSSGPSSPPNVLSRHFNENDDSSSIVFEPVSEAKVDCSGYMDDKLSKIKECESFKIESSKSSRRKKGHRRHWSLDMCVESRPEPSTKMYLYIQMQLCCRDNLHDWLLQNHTWEKREPRVKSLFGQIVSAVEYVHRAGLIHRDLKPSNILFAPDGRVKVGDFGLVTTMHDDSGGEGRPDHHLMHTNKVGTELYMSPELRGGQKYGLEVDIYSMGLILFELYNPCATDMDRIATLRAARAGQYPLRFVTTHPRELEVVKLMLSEDPSQRPTARDLRCRAPLFEIPQESSFANVRARRLGYLSKRKRVLKTRAVVCNKLVSPVRSLRQSIHRATSLETMKKCQSSNIKQLKNYKLPIQMKVISNTPKSLEKPADVLRVLEKFPSMQNHLCTIMSIASHELFQHIVKQVNANKTITTEDKYWHDFRKLAVTLHFYSPDAYECLRKKFNLCLPDPVTISKWYLKAGTRPGFAQQSVDKIRSLTKKKQSLVCLLLNEMKMNEKIELDCDNVFGYASIGNDIQGSYIETANEAILITAVCLTSYWKIPLGLFFGRNFTPTQKSTLLKLCFDILDELNIQVVAVTVAGSLSNMNLARALGANLDDLSTLQPYFMYNDMKRYIILDPLKLSIMTRELFARFKIFYHENEKINFEYVRQLRVLGRFFNSSNKSLTEIWNYSVVNQLERLQSQPDFIDSAPTLKFVRNFSAAFNMLLPRNHPSKSCYNYEQIYKDYFNYIQKLKFADGDLVMQSATVPKLALTWLLCDLFVVKSLHNDFIATKKYKKLKTHRFAPTRIRKRMLSARVISFMYSDCLNKAKVQGNIKPGEYHS